MDEKKRALVPDIARSRRTELSKVDDAARKKLHEFREERRKAKEPRRIMFICDVTGSRAPQWEWAKNAQSRMVDDAMKYGNIEMQIVIYRDRICDANDYLKYSQWSKDVTYLQSFMSRISCYGGGGNDGESIDEALRFALVQDPPASAIILVGDEPVISSYREAAYQYASELGKRNTPIYVFQDGERFDPQARKDFMTIAQNSGGVYDKFTASSRVDFGDRLRVATVFAAGGKDAVRDFLEKHRLGGKALSEGAMKLSRKFLGEGSE